MYKVYCCVDGMPQEVLTTCVTLREANEFARSAAARERRPAVEYRILGPTPRGVPGVMRLQYAGRSATPLSAWFVLDNAPKPRGALRASEVLRSLGEEPRARAAAEKHVREPGRDSCSPSERAKEPSKARRHAPSRDAYSIVREVHGHRQLICEGLETKEDAREYVKRRRSAERDPEAEWIIVAPSDRSGSKPPVGVRSGFLRGAPRLRGYAAGSKTQRKRHDWEVEDRRNDVSLVERPEEELGLGIPAQTNKGRRSRKGEYIP